MRSRFIKWAPWARTTAVHDYRPKPITRKITRSEGESVCRESGAWGLQIPSRQQRVRYETRTNDKCAERWSIGHPYGTPLLCAIFMAIENWSQRELVLSWEKLLKISGSLSLRTDNINILPANIYQKTCRRSKTILCSGASYKSQSVGTRRSVWNEPLRSCAE